METQTLDSGSQPQEVIPQDTNQTIQDTAPVTSDKPLTGDEIKAGMLAEINKGLGEPKEEGEAEQAVKPVDLEAEKKEAKPKEKVEKKPDDKEDLYKMPEGLQKDSRARFQKLVDTAKQANERAERAERHIAEKEAVVTNFKAILDETKTGPEDLSELLEYNRMVKTGDLESALKMLDAQRSNIARMLGRPVEGVDVLDEFNDLKEEVNAGGLTIERAAEIAKARRVQEALQQQYATQQQTQQSAQQKNQVITKALDSIQKFAAGKSATDVDYSKKEEILLKSVEEISSRFPPELWVEQVRMLYDMITVMPAAPTNQGRPAAPLRPNAGGGGSAQPRSMLDAINQGLGYTVPG